MEAIRMAIEKATKEAGSNCPVGDCQKPEVAAHLAVKKVFEILGVDVDDPQQVEEFRKGLRFSEELLKYSDRGKLAILLSFITLATGAIWYGLFGKSG